MKNILQNAHSFNLNHIFPADFENAETENLKTINPPKGVFKLKTSAKSKISKGSLTSAPIKTMFPFDELIISAGALLGSGNSISVSAQVKTRKNRKHCLGKWSKWYSFGVFTSNGKSLSGSSQEDKTGKVAVDILKLKNPCDCFRYKIRLKSSGRFNPVLKQVAAVYTNTKKAYNEKSALKKSFDFKTFKLDVPKISQMATRFEHSKDICSPVSLVMAMNYYGLNEKPLKTASSVYDKTEKIYGNWLFNTQYAATKQFYARIKRFNNLNEAENYILKGIPIIASISFTQGKLKKSPIKSSKGHLVIIKGFTKKGDILVNDPSAAEDKTVGKIYDRKEFAEAWLKNKFGSAYIINPKLPGHAVISKPYCNVMAKPFAPKTVNAFEKIFETQVIAGEKIKILELKNNWAKIKTIEQMRSNFIDRQTNRPVPDCGRAGNDDFALYSGWIDIKCLAAENITDTDIIVKSKRAGFFKLNNKKEFSIGTKLKFISFGKDKTINAAISNGEIISLKKEDIVFNKTVKALKSSALRTKLLKTARQFLGDKYSWGGRSGFETDCSGLVNLSYRVLGINLPRNACDQFIFAKAVNKKNFKPADLIFSSQPENKKEIDHVMIYSEKDNLIEATRETNSIREISFKEKFGKNLSDIKNGQLINGSKVYFRKIIKK